MVAEMAKTLLQVYSQYNMAKVHSQYNMAKVHSQFYFAKAKKKNTNVSRAPPHLVEMPRIYTFFSLKRKKKKKHRIPSDSLSVRFS